MKKRGLTLAERQLKRELFNNADSFDDAGIDNADGNFALGQGAGNPMFIANFNLSVYGLYFTVNGGVYTKITPATLNAALQNDLPFFLFGLLDKASGYRKLKGQYPINSNWTYGIPFIYGAEAPTIAIDIDATVEAELRDGDMVIPFTSALPGAGTTTLGLRVIRCKETGFGSVLEALVQDWFRLNQIRYNIPDNSQIDQFAEEIGVFGLSLFGKFGSDSLNPNTFKDPDQQQGNIIDIPFGKVVTKNTALAGYLLYTTEQIDLSMYVRALDKTK